MLIQFDLRDGAYGLKLDKDDGTIRLRCTASNPHATSCAFVLDEGQAIDLTDALLKALDRKVIDKP